MKRIAALIITIALIAIGNPANAQTSTPTPGPICGSGYYEQTASCVIYGAGWSTSSNAVFSGGSLTSTTTVGGTLTFRMYGTTLVLYRTTSTTGTTANFCVDAACQTISFNSGTSVNMSALAFDVNCLNICNISITHNGAGGSGVNLDAFAIYANIATDTPIPTATPLTPLATWTNQVPTAAATWTAQPTSGDRGERILTNGFYEEVDAGLNFIGSWSLDLSSSYRNGAAYTTTTQSSYLTFTFYGSAAALLIRKSTSGDDLEVCVNTSCSTIDGNASNTFQVSTSIATSLAGERTVRIRKATNNANPIYIDAVDITGWATATPIPTWTAQVPATWTAQPAGLTALPTWTPQMEGGSYVIDGLSYASVIEDSDAAIAYHGNWQVSSGSTILGGTRHYTSSFDAYLTFTVSNITGVSITFYRDGSGDDVLVCPSSSVCTTVSGSGLAGGFNQFFAAPSAQTYTITIRKATNNSNTIYFDDMTIAHVATSTPILPYTPLPTWTAQPAGFTPLPTWTAQPAGFTPLPTWTAQPYFATPLPTWTAQIPATWTAQPYFATPLPTWTAQPYFATSLPTWTAQPGAFTPLPTWTPYLYPTPLDTWTPQPAAMIVITVDSSAVIDWNGLLTVYPTMVTQIPATLTPSITPTPTETLTPSVTPTPTETPLPVAMVMTLVDAQGTPVASGTVNLEMSVGEIANTVWLFALTMATLVGSLITLRRRRV